ncbi:eukaryotic membrane protein family-domain-containing protein [Coemansia spiralis]|nr:eukaryotic membrane protein family-domain-containing protein [Coemansia spiralis]
MPENGSLLSGQERGLRISVDRFVKDHAPPVSPKQTSPSQRQKQRMRDTWRHSLLQSQHSHSQARRSSSPTSRPRSVTNHYQPVHARTNHNIITAARHDGLPLRLSLDSQCTAIDSSHGSSPIGSRSSSRRGSGRSSVAEPYMVERMGSEIRAPMWSEEQLRRARRFSSSHIRGVSCPTLNITRIMRSISVSSINGGGRAPSRFSRRGFASPISPVAGTGSQRQLRQQHGQQMDISPKSLDPVFADLVSAFAGTRDSQKASTTSPALAISTTLNSNTDTTDTKGALSSNHSSDSSNIDSYNVMSSHLIKDSSQTSCSTKTTTSDPLPTMFPEKQQQQQQQQLHAEGLRRRVAGRQRNVGTPDISIVEEEENESEEEPLLSPSLSEHPLLAASNNRSGSECSSARWSTISAEPPHKRYSYSSAAIAEARLSAISQSSTSLLSPSDRAGNENSGGETMTITLKAPQKRDSAEPSQKNNDNQGENETQRFSGTNSDDDAFRDRSSYDSRFSTSSESVAIPAVYLDSTASLLDQYVAELQSSEFDPNIHLKRQRVLQFLRIPWNVEKLLWFGVVICIDALLYVFSILPAKFTRSLVKLGAFASSFVQKSMRLLPLSWSRLLTRLGLCVQRWSLRISGRNSNSSNNSSETKENGDGTVVGGYMGRWLSPMQLFDLYRGLLLIVTCFMLCRIDAAQMYHGIRAQSSLKLYFIYSALDIFDRLLSSFGHDALDALQSTVTDPWSQRWKAGAVYFVVAQVYMLVHTLVLFYQVITLNVAVNAYSDQLLSLLISNQFVEIKSNVFKKWEKEMLFQISCADIVERFQHIVFLFIIILRNLAELSGNGFSPLFGASPSTTTQLGTATTTPVIQTAQPPVSFDKATPSAFGPLIPSWVSMPIVNRIATPILMVLGTEILIDWIKHAFVTKLNWIRPEIYSHYIDILSRDLACSKSGSKVGIKPPVLSTEGHEEAPTTSGSDADEKIARSSTDGAWNIGESSRCSSPSNKQQRQGIDRKMHREATSNFSTDRDRTRSSSILVHAVVKAFEWIKINTGQGSNEDDSGLLHNNRRLYGHQRKHSVTKPQLFVEQSTRVSRRLGLSPMPLACLITLMLMQVLHILVWPSRSHQNNSIAGSTSDLHIGFGINSWIVDQISGVPILGSLGVIFVGGIGWVLSKVVFSVPTVVGHAIMNPREAAIRIISVLFLDVVGWAAFAFVAYAVVVWIKLGAGSRLMEFAWGRYRAFEQRTNDLRGMEQDTSNLKQFDDATRKLDRDAFSEVGKLINKEKSEAEWEKQRPKWTLDNIERFSLFKSRIQ